MALAEAIFKTRVVKVCAPADWLSALQLLGESVQRETRRLVPQVLGLPAISEMG